MTNKMKKMLILLVIVIIPSFIYPKITYRFASSGTKSNAVFSEIFLDVFGEEAYLKMIYLTRNTKKSFLVNEIVITDSIIHHSHLIPIIDADNSDSIYKLILKQHNYIQLLDSGFLVRDKAEKRDTMLLFADKDLYGFNLANALPELKKEKSVLLRILSPDYNILRDSITDTLSWEREAIASVKKRIYEAQRRHTYYWKPLSTIPDSLQQLYEIYNR